MHRVVPTSISIVIIIALAIFVAAYTLMGSNELAFPENTQALAIKDVEDLSQKSIVENKDTSDKDMPVPACKARAFQGEEKIAVWKIMKDDEIFLQVAKKDIHKLPFDNINNFKLIDQTAPIEEQLASSSEENPVQIDVSGFAVLCDGTTLACLDYKEGVFSSYLTD